MNATFGPEDWEQNRMLWAQASKPYPSVGRSISQDKPLESPSQRPSPCWLYPSVLVVAGFAALVACGLLFIFELGENEHRILSVYRDGVARIDFAAPYNGAMFISELTSTFTTAQTKATHPDYIQREIHPSIVFGSRTLDPGICWRIEGGSGQIAVKFALPVTVTHITVDHIPRPLVSSVLNAPRQIHVWGFLTNSPQHLLPQRKVVTQLPMLNIPKYTFYHIGTIEYDIERAENVQSFHLDHTKHPMEGVVVEIHNSWGNKHACLYRIRIHGVQAMFGA